MKTLKLVKTKGEMLKRGDENTAKEPVRDKEIQKFFRLKVDLKGLSENIAKRQKDEKPSIGKRPSDEEFVKKISSEIAEGYGLGSDAQYRNDVEWILPIEIVHTLYTGLTGMRVKSWGADGGVGVWAHSFVSEAFDRTLVFVGISPKKNDGKKEGFYKNLRECVLSARSVSLVKDVPILYQDGEYAYYSKQLVKSVIEASKDGSDGPRSIYILDESEFERWAGDKKNWFWKSHMDVSCGQFPGNGRNLHILNPKVYSQNGDVQLMGDIMISAQGPIHISRVCIDPSKEEITVEDALTNSGVDAKIRDNLNQWIVGQIKRVEYFASDLSEKVHGVDLSIKIADIVSVLHITKERAESFKSGYEAFLKRENKGK